MSVRVILPHNDLPYNTISLKSTKLIAIGLVKNYFLPFAGLM